MQFPAPQRLPLGPLMDFGYEDEVLFPLKLHVADGVKGGPVNLHAKVDWLVCRATCIPGKAELEVRKNVWDGMYEIPYSHRTLGSLFLGRPSKSLPDIPEPLPSSDRAVFQPTKEGFRLWVETGQTEAEASFFPSDENILDNPAPQMLTPTAKGLILEKEFWSFRAVGRSSLRRRQARLRLNRWHRRHPILPPRRQRCSHHGPRQLPRSQIRPARNRSRSVS
jgi:thiol:disulfide interchange protein DsbD